MTLTCLVLPSIHRFEWVAATQALAACAGAIFAPAVAAVTLGIVGPKAFAKRIGRNEAFNHAGNAAAAAIAGATAYFCGPIVVFWLLAAMAVASVAATLSIPADAIDDHLARGLGDGTYRNTSHDDQPSGLQVLLTCKPLLVFALATILFHFSNAAMLPLVGQKLALVNRDLGTTLMSVCIIAAQLVMVPVAMLGARLTRGDASRYSPWHWPCWRCAARSIRSPTIPIGWYPCNCLTASAPAFSARCFRLWSPISLGGPGVSM